MNKIKILCLVVWMLLFPVLISCSSEKDIAARRNLMMPKKTDLPRNSKYQGMKKKKTYKKKNKKRKTKKLTYNNFSQHNTIGMV